jgi:dTDP-4-dehydrorhamnose 3,5-epimerase
MIFTPTKIESAWILDIERREDDRGFFARSFCTNEFREHGLNAQVTQINVGYTSKKGGLRGLHYQLAPHAEIKIVRCTRGAIFDVVLDLRIDSPTFKRWVGCELTADNHRILVVPEGCAHGYQTLQDDAEVEYMTTAAYAPQAARGVRYDDPIFKIDWPIPVTMTSKADKSWPDFQERVVDVLIVRDGNGYR